MSKWHQSSYGIIFEWLEKNNIYLKTYKNMLPILRQRTPSITLLDKFFDDDFFAFPTWNELAVRNPLHDVIENEKEFSVELSLAGVKKEDIVLNIDHDVLSIKAERKETDQKFNRKQTFYGKYEKSFTLPDSVDRENIQASFENGMLKISIPKFEEVNEKVIKQIEIK